jgi:hypothetical protein
MTMKKTKNGCNCKATFTAPDLSMSEYQQLCPYNSDDPSSLDSPGPNSMPITGKEWKIKETVPLPA